jgi:cyclohexadienyl dehydratase
VVLLVFMKKTIVGLVLALALVSCGAIPGLRVEIPTSLPAPNLPAPTPLPALPVGTSGDYRPFSFYDADGTLTGFDVRVAERLAAYLERRLELVPFRWPELTSALQADAFDIAMSGVTIRPDRAVQLAFSRPYICTGAVAVIRASARAKFGRLEDLDHPNVRIVVNAGGHLEQVARQRFGHARITPIHDNTALPVLLLNGEADAAISEELEAHTWPTAELVALGPFTHDCKAYALRPADADRLRRVNAWLAAQEGNGWLNTQRRNWFGAQTILTPQQAGFQALVSAIDLRLQLMPYVAAVKRRERLPVRDPAQEARVLAHVREEAAAERLNADDVAALFRAQIDAAKAIESRAQPVTTDATLADVRAAVARVTDAVIAELGRCAPWLREPRLRDQLDRMLRRRLAAAGLTAPMIETLTRATCQVRMQPRTSPRTHARTRSSALLANTR